MSNCIKILGRNAVPFFPEQFDTKAYKAFLAGVTEADSGHSKERPDEYVAYWFLQTCSDFEDDAVVVRVGEGRSTHTWRDLNSLCQVLSRFTNCRLAANLKVVDTDCGNDKPQVVRLCFFKPDNQSYLPHIQAL